MVAMTGTTKVKTRANLHPVQNDWIVRARKFTMRKTQVPDKIKIKMQGTYYINLDKKETSSDKPIPSLSLMES